MSRKNISNPRENLATIIRATGLPQTKLAEEINSRGYSVSRATVNRWANPQNQKRSFSYNPDVMETLIDICSKWSGIAFTIQDVFNTPDELSEKIKASEKPEALLPRIRRSADTRSDLSAISALLCGSYRLVPDFGHSVLSDEVRFLTILQDEADSILVRATPSKPALHDDDDRRDSADTGRLIFWDQTAMIFLEIGALPIRVATITLALMNHTAPLREISGLFSISSHGQHNLPAAFPVKLVRLDHKDDFFPNVVAADGTVSQLLAVR